MSDHAFPTRPQVPWAGHATYSPYDFKRIDERLTNKRIGVTAVLPTRIRKTHKKAAS